MPAKENGYGPHIMVRHTIISTQKSSKKKNLVLNALNLEAYAP